MVIKRLLARTARLYCRGRSYLAPGWIAQLHYLKHLAIIDATYLFGESGQKRGSDETSHLDGFFIS